MFGGMRCFLVSHVAPIEDAPDGALGHLHGIDFVEMPGQLIRSQVPGLTDQPQDLIGMSFELM